MGCPSMSYRLARHDDVPTSSANIARSSRSLTVLTLALTSVTVSLMPRVAPFGGWRSPITATAIASREVPLSTPEIVENDVYWLEGKALEGGGVGVVELGAGGAGGDVTASPFY